MNSLFNAILLTAFVISSVQSCNWHEARDCMMNDPMMQDLKDCGSPEEFMKKLSDMDICNAVHNLHPCLKNMEKGCIDAMPEGPKKLILSILEEEDIKNMLTDEQSCALLEIFTQSAKPLMECVMEVKKKEEYKEAQKYEAFIHRTVEKAYVPICCALSKLSKCDEKDKLIEDCDQMSQTILMSVDEIGKKMVQGFCGPIDSDMDVCQQCLAEMED
ncbi:uncharacterized protein [Parasteatoda tepidariorum]|uniref:uncharacterized protein n=1 Tax=Parasteatoda tepidariorum TaxID=114398 RepID=UPI001C724A4C|nr:uncharacterized protein LOC107454122 [Parasteatoda tepidariorum]